MQEVGTGKRLNAGKVRHDLTPAFAQEQYAKVLTFGENKYGARNWENGMNWSKVLASMERHLQAIKRGEDMDQETGLLHSAHIMCNAAFLTEYYKIFPQGDDRPHNYLRKPKIGLDIDEVICDWVGAWVKRYSYKTPTSWSFDGAISKKFKAMRERGTLDKFYLNLDPKCLPADIPFEPHCYITSRPVESEITAEWLHKHGFPARPVITVQYGKSKADAAKEAGIDWFIDDSYQNFVDLNNAGICCFLFDAPHNKRYNVGHKRIHSLKELA